MSKDEKSRQPIRTTAIAEVRTKPSVSIVWLIPLIALLIGGWLTYKAYSEQGPLISITFHNAEGLEAGKTKIKYKDVIIGEVEEIKLAEKLEGVVVLARMDKDAAPYLTEKTRFWVVRARISAGEVSGLGTLLSGAYIGIDPIMKGKPERNFTGLAKQPLVTANIPGQHFLLRTPTLGSLNIGSPVFFRQIKVGEVVDFNFDQNGDALDVKIFIHSPHQKRISSATKFWNASGIDVKLDASGIKVDTQSLISIIQGGIAFDTLPSLETKSEIAENHQFQLHPNREAAAEKTFTIKNDYLMYFDQSVRGLTPGAPVEFRGIPIGEVIDIKLILDADRQEARIPVLVVIEPERFELWLNGEKIDSAMGLKKLSGIDRDMVGEGLLKHGLRAQLDTGNLLTGQLYIKMDFFPDAKPAEITYENGHAVFPTVPTPFGQIAEKVSSTLKKIDSLPFAELGEELRDTIGLLRATLNEYKGVAGNINQQFLPNLNQTLEQLQQTMTGMEKTFGSDSALSYKTQQTLDELTGAIRSIRSVADQLDRNPRALIFGRGESKQ